MLVKLEDGLQITVEVSKDKVKVSKDKVKVKAGEGYYSHVNTLMTLKDNGNGYYVKRKSYSSVEPDHVFNLGYDEIEYLYYAYKAILEKKGLE